MAVDAGSAFQSSYALALTSTTKPYYGAPRPHPRAFLPISLMCLAPGLAKSETATPKVRGAKRKREEFEPLKGRTNL